MERKKNNKGIIVRFYDAVGDFGWKLGEKISPTMGFVFALMFSVFATLLALIPILMAVCLFMAAVIDLTRAGTVKSFIQIQVMFFVAVVIVANVTGLEKKAKAFLKKEPEPAEAPPVQTAVRQPEQYQPTFVCSPPEKKKKKKKKKKAATVQQNAADRPPDTERAKPKREYVKDPILVQREAEQARIAEFEKKRKEEREKRRKEAEEFIIFYS